MAISTKILVGGLLVALVVLVVGKANTYRIESKLHKLVADCLTKPTPTEQLPPGVVPESWPEGFTPVCDPNKLMQKTGTVFDDIADQDPIVRTQRELLN